MLSTNVASVLYTLHNRKMYKNSQKQLQAQTEASLLHKSRHSVGWVYVTHNQLTHLIYFTTATTASTKTTNNTKYVDTGLTEVL